MSSGKKLFFCVRGTAGEGFICLVSTSCASTDHLFTVSLFSPGSAGEPHEADSTAATDWSVSVSSKRLAAFPVLSWARLRELLFCGIVILGKNSHWIVANCVCFTGVNVFFLCLHALKRLTWTIPTCICPKFVTKKKCQQLCFELKWFRLYFLTTVFCKAAHAAQAWNRRRVVEPPSSWKPVVSAERWISQKLQLLPDEHLQQQPQGHQCMQLLAWLFWVFLPSSSQQTVQCSSLVMPALMRDCLGVVQCSGRGNQIWWTKV